MGRRRLLLCIDGITPDQAKQLKSDLESRLDVEVVVVAGTVSHPPLMIEDEPQPRRGRRWSWSTR